MTGPTGQVPASPLAWTADVLAPVALPADAAGALEEVLEGAAHSPVASLSASLTRTVRRPSKRLRPGLLLAAARAAGTAGEKKELLRRAAAVELLHLGSLVHDDLMDRADTRGGEPTVYRTHRAAGAVLGGDRLLAAGGALIADAGPQAHRVWHDAFLAMCDGQGLETANRHRLTTPAEYLRQVHGKTAALIGAACVLGALPGRTGGRRAARERPGAVRALARYGTCFGVVLQIADDLMDALSTPERWGKPVEHDIPQGVYTLPVLLAARSPADTRLAGLLRPGMSAADADAAYGMVRQAGVAPAVAIARAWAARARRSLTAAGLAHAAGGALAELPARYLEGVLATAPAPRHASLVPSAPAQSATPTARNGVFAHSVVILA